MREQPVSTEDLLRKQLVAKSQEGLRVQVRASLLVTTGIVPTKLAAQTLVG